MKKFAIVILLVIVALARARAVAAQTAGATLLVEARDPGGASMPGVLVTAHQPGHRAGARRRDRGRRHGVAGAAARGRLHADRGQGRIQDRSHPEHPGRGGRARPDHGPAEPGRLHRAGRGRGGRDDAADRQQRGRRGVRRRDAAGAAESPNASRWNSPAQAPGMAPPAPGSRLSTQGNTGINSAGAREAANNYLLDGVDNNDQFLNRLVINPSLDAIQEFARPPEHLRRGVRAQRRGAAEHGPQVGHADAARIGLRVLPSFRAGCAQRARHRGRRQRPLRQRHQFGATLGGPLGLPLSFFFVSGEGINGREADTRQAHVPTAAERAGDFSASGVAVRDPSTGLPFPGGVIPASRLSAAGVAAAGLYPTPNRADAQANFVSSPLSDRTAGQFTIKTDHTVWHGSPLTFRYSFSRDSRDLPFPVRGRNLPGFGISVLDQGHNFGAGLTKALTRADLQRAARRRQRPAAREPPAELRHQRFRPRSGSPDRRSRPPTSASPRWSCRATKRSATIRTCRWCGARARSTCWTR